MDGLRTISTAVVTQNKYPLATTTDDEAYKEFRDFLVELNQSICLGLTVGELETLVTVSEDLFLSLGADSVNAAQVSAIPSRHQCSRNVENSVKCVCKWNAMSPPCAPLSPQLADQGPAEECSRKDSRGPKSSAHACRKSYGWVRSSEVCRTLSLVLPQKSAMRKTSYALTCTHESFPHYEPLTHDEHERTSKPVETKFANDNGHPISSFSPSDQCTKFQCRVIFLSEREHLLLCKYEKSTKSFERLNEALKDQPNLQLFLLRITPEVHVSGNRFEDGRLELLRELRRAAMWWDRHMDNTREKLGVRHSTSPKKSERESSDSRGSQGRVDTDVSALTPQLASRDFSNFCTDHPDCKNSLYDDGTQSGKASCLPIVIHPRKKHSILVAYDKNKNIIEQLKELFKFENCGISLLRGKPMFHVSGSKEGSVTVFMLKDLVRRASSEHDIGKWLMERGVLPVLPNTSAAASGAATADASKSTKTAPTREERSQVLVYLSKNETDVRKYFDSPLKHTLIQKPSVTSHHLNPLGQNSLRKESSVPPQHVDQLDTNLLDPWFCQDYPDCTNSGTRSKYDRSIHCRPVKIGQRQHKLLLDHPIYRDKIVSHFLKLSMDPSDPLQICLLKKINAFHVCRLRDYYLDPVCKVIESFFSIYSSVQELRERLDKLESPAGKSLSDNSNGCKKGWSSWYCINYPDCTNLELGERDNGYHCRAVPISKWKQKIALEPAYKIEAYFRNAVRRWNENGNVRICLLKNTSEFHIFGPAHLQDTLQVKILEIFDVDGSVCLRKKLSELHRLDANRKNVN